MGDWCQRRAAARRSERIFRARCARGRGSVCTHSAQRIVGDGRLRATRPGARRGADGWPGCGGRTALARGRGWARTIGGEQTLASLAGSGAPKTPLSTAPIAREEGGRWGGRGGHTAQFLA